MGSVESHDSIVLPNEIPTTKDTFHTYVRTFGWRRCFRASSSFQRCAPRIACWWSWFSGFVFHSVIKMSARIAMRATQDESVDHLLVHWSEEDCTSVVALKNVVKPCPPNLHNPCVIQAGKKIFTGVAVQIGSKRRLSELQSDFVDGSFEIPVQQSERQESRKRKCR